MSDFHGDDFEDLRRAAEERLTGDLPDEVLPPEGPPLLEDAGPEEPPAPTLEGGVPEGAEVVAGHVIPPPESQWSIFKRMFLKKRSAVWGLRVTIGLILVAIYAPVAASGEPFIWRGAEPGAGLTFPWFTNLFDERVWEHSLDRFFNLLMVAVTFWFVLRGVAWLLARLTGWTEAGRRRFRQGIRKPYVALVFLLAVVQAFGPIEIGDKDEQGGHPFELALTTTRPRVVYPDLARRYQRYNELAVRRDEVLARTEDRAAYERYVTELEQAELDEDEDPAQHYTKTREALVAEERPPLELAWGERQYGDRAEYTHVFPVVPYGYREQEPDEADRFLPAFSFARGVHVLGTTEEGSDVFARILYGTRISLTIGLVAVSIYVTIGTILGALAGFLGGRVDLVIMRLVEIMLCIPSFFLLLMIVALADNRSIFLIMAAIGIVSWTGTTRLVRGEFLRERGKEYVDAARVAGFRESRIIFRHVLPNALGPVLVTATFGVAAAILTEAGLSFIGLGDVTLPSWGQILNHGRVNNYWHLIIPPSVAIFVTVTSMNLVGEGVRDALDPKLRK